MDGTIASRALWPARGQVALVRDAMLVVGGSILMAVSAKAQIPAPVPFTMQPWAVVLLGAVLGRRLGLSAMVLYLLEGAAGLPVFARPGAGPGYLLGPTGGYLWSFPVAAYVVGALAERGWDRRFGSAVAAFAMGQLLILALGCAWLSGYVGAKVAVWEGLLKFLPGDVLKCLLAATALPWAWRLVGRGRGLETPSDIRW